MIEINRAKSGIIYIGRDRGSHGQGTQCSGNKARLAGFVADVIGRFACNAGRDVIYFARRFPQGGIVYDSMKELLVFAAIVWFFRKKKFMQANGGRAESVRLDDIGARAQIFFMDPLDHLGFGQQQEFDGAFEIFAFPIAKTVAAIIGFVRLESLDMVPMAPSRMTMRLRRSVAKGWNKSGTEGKKTVFALSSRNKLTHHDM